MLLMPITTTVLLLSTIHFNESHVIIKQPSKRDSIGIRRNIDIPQLIDPLQQGRQESEDEQLRWTKSVFNVPSHNRQENTGILDCPEGSRRVVENGPCEQQAATIKSSGDKFLVDSLRKFYSPPTPTNVNSNTNTIRPHHRRRRPTSTTTTTRRYDFGKYKSWRHGILV